MRARQPSVVSRQSSAVSCQPSAVFGWGGWVLVGCALAFCGVAATAQEASEPPGAAFEARLRQAERRLLPPPKRAPSRAGKRPVRRVARPVQRVARPVRRAGRPTQRQRVAVRIAPGRVVRSVERPAVAPVVRAAPPLGAEPRQAGQPWVFQSSKLLRVTYSLDRRGPRSGARQGTGDLVLRAEPAGVPVFYYLDGGAQVEGITRAWVRNRRLPQRGKVQLVASAPRLGGRASVFVPLKAGHVTTVRFVFGETPSAGTTARRDGAPPDPSR